MTGSETLYQRHFFDSPVIFHDRPYLEAFSFGFESDAFSTS